MFSVEKCRKIDPNHLQDLSDEEVESLREDLYALGELALISWVTKKAGSKNLEWLLFKTKEDIP